jgi:hypothetical protein
MQPETDREKELRRELEVRQESRALQSQIRSLNTTIEERESRLDSINTSIAIREAELLAKDQIPELVLLRGGFACHVLREIGRLNREQADAAHHAHNIRLMERYLKYRGWSQPDSSRDNWTKPGFAGGKLRWQAMEQLEADRTEMSHYIAAHYADIAAVMKEPQ